MEWAVGKCSRLNFLCPRKPRNSTNKSGKSFGWDPILSFLLNMPTFPSPVWIGIKWSYDWFDYSIILLLIYLFKLKQEIKWLIPAQIENGIMKMYTIHQRILSVDHWPHLIAYESIYVLNYLLNWIILIILISILLILIVSFVLIILITLII